MPNNHRYEIMHALAVLAQKLGVHVCHRLIPIGPDRPASSF